MAAADAELLKRAVVSLEKKLRESQAAALALKHQVAELQRETAEAPALRAQLAEARAAYRQLEDGQQQLRRELGAAQAETEEARRQRDRAQEAAEAAQAAAEAAAAQAAVRRADGEALQLEGTRARGRADVLEAQVQQLEEANAGLRQDSRQHASKLREAYEREGELLAELAELQRALRHAAQSQPGGGGPQPPLALCAAAEAGDGSGGAAKEPQLAAAEAAVASAEEAHREVFMAAAKQLTQECAAKVEQAESRAAHLEQQLHSMSAAMEQLRQQAAEQQARLQAAQEQCGREQAATGALLTTNLRLHEAVMALMGQAGCSSGSDNEGGQESAGEEGDGVGGGGKRHDAECSCHSGREATGRASDRGPAPTAAAGVASARTGKLAPQQQRQQPPSHHHRHPQQQYLRQQQALHKPPGSAAPAALRPQPSKGMAAAAGRLHAGRGLQAKPAHPAGSWGSSEQEAEGLSQAVRAPRRQSQADLAGQAAPASWHAGRLGSMQAEQPLRPPARAAAPSRASPGCQLSHEHQAAAVQAALSLSAEHRELHARYQAVTGELNRVASGLAAAAASKQLVLLRQHAELQAELREVSEQLEDRLVQLTALRQAGLL